MSINYLEIENFKTFLGAQRFDFSNVSEGLYFVSGDNQIDAKLGSNAAGKSTFFSDALMWVLTNKTSLGIKAGNVRNWNSKKGCRGLLGLSVGGVEYEILRTWSPNSLQLKTGPGEFSSVSQEYLEDLLGYSHASLLYSVIVSQFSSKFFDLDPAVKLQVFSDILGDLDVWLGYSDKAKEKAESVDFKLRRASETLSRYLGKLETLESQDFTELEKTWGSERELEKSKLLRTIEETRHSVDVMQKDLCSIKKDSADVLPCRESIEKQILEKCERLQDLDISIKDVQKKIEKNMRIIGIEESVLHKFQKAEEVCPYCEQDVTKEYKKKKVKSIEAKIEDLFVNLGLEEEEETLKSFEEVKIEVTKSKEGLGSQLREIDIQLDEFENLENAILNKIENANRFLKDSLKSYEVVLNKQNPYTQMIDDNEKNKKEIESEIKKVEAEIKDLEVLKDSYTYWVKAYKEIRLLVIQEALYEFEIYLNNSLQNLDLYGWSIKVDIDKETKSKTIKKGFYVNVSSPFQKEEAPFECYCGGERGRLLLAATLGLMEFVKSRKPSGFDIEVWDEPSVHLSPEGIRSLLELLKSRSNNKKIFFIDHHKLENSGEFSGRLCVVKNLDGSRIEVVE